MTNTDSTPFMDLVPADFSLRENERGMQIGAGWNPHWHQPTDLYSTYSDKDFLLGLNAAQTTLGRGRAADRNQVQELSISARHTRSFTGEEATQPRGAVHGLRPAIGRSQAGRVSTDWIIESAPVSAGLACRTKPRPSFRRLHCRR